MKRSLLGLALITSAMAANAQTKLVQDINPGTGSSYPVRLTPFGHQMVFGANDGTNGEELWSMTDSLTQIAYNINPSTSSSIIPVYNRTMAVLGNNVYFPADNGTSGTELYSWSGKTGDAPALVAEIMAGASGSSIDEIVEMNGKLYFDANDGSYGQELWSYDTATAMATRLSDIYAGANSSFISSIIAYNGKIYFSAYNSTTGAEFYSYDPATNSTSIVLDIDPGVSSSSPNNFTIINGKLYFSASTTTYGRELYMYNGSNVQRLTDLVSGSGNGMAFSATGVSKIVGMGDAIYLSGEDGTYSGHLYKYDSKTGITSLVYKTNPTGSSVISNMTMYAGKMYFSANNTAAGNELWMYTGSGIPTLVADIRAGAGSSSPAEFRQWGKNLYFSAYDSATGVELYKLYDSSVLAVQNVKFNADVKVYPNPATSVATIDVNLQQSQKLSINVLDMNGRVVYTVPVTGYNSGSNKIVVPVSDLALGIYLFTLHNEAGSMMFSGRLLKQ